MIPKYKTLLYATDLSTSAAHAFRHAVSLARTYNGRIHLLHVLPRVDAGGLNYISTVPGEEEILALAHEDEIRDQIRLKLHSFAKEELVDHPDDLDRIAEIEIHHGNPVAQILLAADRVDADLIIIGSHGKGALKYAFWGSMAEKLLRKSQRAILVIPLND